MGLIKYDIGWKGIDSGREGLWKEPIWEDVLRIIGKHEGEHVYDPQSPIYGELETFHPDQAWRSTTAQGHFRPLFRDYPNSWTRTGVVTLARQRFGITSLGKEVLEGAISKSVLLVNMFKSHIEKSGAHRTIEKPFAILAGAFQVSPRPLSTKEVFWFIMKNFRPTEDDLQQVMKKAILLLQNEPPATPYRRLKNMLSLLRTAGAIESIRRRQNIYWSALDRPLLGQIAKGCFHAESSHS